MDIDRLRDETPGCRGTIHVNNAGAALAPTAVTDAVINHLRMEAEIGGYEAADAALPDLERSYVALARLIGADPSEIACVENATRAWDMAFYAIPFLPGDRVLTTTSEYASNAIAFLQVARNTGAVVEVVPDDESGQLDTEALAGMLDERVRLVAINHIPTHNGLINPAAEVGALTREAGVLYLVDACQSVGQVAIDVDDIGCDLLSTTGRKFMRGPRGTGFLYARGSVVESLEPPLLDLHAATWTGPDSYEIRGDARRFENFERSVAGQLGLGVAAEYAMEVGLDAIEQRVRALGDQLRTQLEPLPGVRVHDRGRDQCGIVTFTKEGRDAEAIVADLARQRINARTSRQTYRYDQNRPDQRDQRDQRDQQGIPGPRPTVRASVHYYNTEDEIDRLVAAVAAS